MCAARPAATHATHPPAPDLRRRADLAHAPPLTLSSQDDTGRLFYDVRQQILLAPADDSSSTGEGGDAKVLAECYVRMVFLKDGALSKPPQRIVDSIEARRPPSTRRTGKSARRVIRVR